MEIRHFLQTLLAKEQLSETRSIAFSGSQMCLSRLVSWGGKHALLSGGTQVSVTLESMLKKRPLTWLKPTKNRIVKAKKIPENFFWGENKKNQKDSQAAKDKGLTQLSTIPVDNPVH